MMGMEVRSAGVWSNPQDYSAQSNLHIMLHHFIFCIDHVSYRKNNLWNALEVFHCNYLCIIYIFQVEV